MFLPISTNQVLVRTTNSEQPAIDHQKLNKDIAKCSFEQFIASEHSEQLVELIDLIGMDSGLVSEEEIQAFVSSSITDIDKFVSDSK